MNYRGNIIANDWHHTVEAEAVLQSLFNNGVRKQFGVLERPHILSNTEEVSYKLWFVGRTGIGKTAAINRLAGVASKNQHYAETSGIRKTCIYWPSKVWEKIIVFKLDCWECGDISGKKYSHIIPACRDKADIIIIVFSFQESTSLRDAQSIVSSLWDGPARIVLGVRYNPYTNMAIKISEVQEFANRNQIEVVTLEEAGIHEGLSEMLRVAPLLNAVCQTLWKRDQDFVLMQNKGIQV